MAELMTKSAVGSPSVEASELSVEMLAESVIRLMKQDISERFKKSRELSDWDAKFCETIDWHPVDELPLKKEVVEELKNVDNEPHIEMTPEKLEKLMGLK